MATESIGNVSAATNSVQNTNVGQEDLFKIMLSQLSYQDPLKPMDNQEFIAKLAQFTNLELNRQMNEKMDALLSFQASNQSINLIGKTVEVTTAAGQQLGTVSSVSFENGIPRLTVQNSFGAFLSDISLSQILIVR
ncbi:MAG: flagellar hook capping protein [Gammaproteobacteria bacterium]|nr:flagellar hook capping protein [Gammaproteobacteria bacterium]MDH5728577.1 flagellar hook capping protein [Gammaproteobacteria bacterium]